MRTAYLGLGSNLGQSKNTLVSALDYLSQAYSVNVQKCSSMYRSKPLIHPANVKNTENSKNEESPQPDYINAVACVTGEFTALELLDILQAVEAHFGRVRDGERWASRTLDLDILLFDDELINELRLTVPHVGLLQRDFVLYPLVEIAPNIEIPGFGSISIALEACENRGLEKLNDHHD